MNNNYHCFFKTQHIWLQNDVIFYYHQQLNYVLVINLYRSTNVHDIIDNETYTKLDHDLTKSSINPTDRQNYRSCLKLTSADLFKNLNGNVNTR